MNQIIIRELKTVRKQQGMVEHGLKNVKAKEGATQQLLYIPKNMLALTVALQVCMICLHLSGLSVDLCLFIPCFPAFFDLLISLGQ